jgi:HEAT repeat protein
MTHTRWKLLGICTLIAAGCAMAAKPSALEENYRSQIEPLLAGMAATDIPARQGPQQTLEKLCHQAAAPEKEKEREALSSAIMSFTGTDTAKPARVWLLRKIETLGKEEVVEGLAKLMHDSDAEIADLARRALANNPSDKALAALRTDLAAAKTPEWTVALVNALAWRHDEKSVETFAKLAAEKDAVGAAAISALGEVGNEAAANALASLRKSAPEAAKADVVNASLRAAERLAASGKVPAAKGIYEELAGKDCPENVRMAGITGLACIQGAEAVPMLLTVVAGDDVHLRLTAGRCLAKAPQDKKVTKLIAEALKKASPPAKALLIDVLGERGDSEALTFVMANMEDADADVRLATYAAMGRLGTAPTVHVLVAQAAKSNGEQLDTIRTAVSNLKGKDVDDEIAKMLKSANGALRPEVIMAVWSRRVVAAKPTVLELANDKDEKVRLAVLAALERLANENDLPTLAEQLSPDKGEACVKAAEKAITSVCRRAGQVEKCVAPLATALPKATPAAQVAIVRALAKIQGEAALAAIRSVAKSDNQDVSAAAKAALAEWKPVYITKWLAAGPFKQEGKDLQALFDIAFPPETEDGKAEWKPLKEVPSGEFDLSPIGKGDNCCVYVKTTIISATKQDMILSVGSDDGAKLWLNGKVIHEKNVTRSLKCGEDEIKVSLNEGPNTLLLKVTQGAGEFQFCCAMKAAEGGPPDGVKCEAK